MKLITTTGLPYIQEITSLYPRIQQWIKKRYRRVLPISCSALTMFAGRQQTEHPADLAHEKNPSH